MMCIKIGSSYVKVGALHRHCFGEYNDSSYWHVILLSGVDVSKDKGAIGEVNM